MGVGVWEDGVRETWSSVFTMSAEDPIERWTTPDWWRAPRERSEARAAALRNWPRSLRKHSSQRASVFVNQNKRVGEVWGERGVAYVGRHGCV